MNREQEARALAELRESKPAIGMGAITLAMGGASGAELPQSFQVFSSGQWATHPAGEFALGEEQFQQIIDNQRAAGVMPCIDREHECWNTFGVEPPGARGWITQLSMEPDPNNDGKPGLFATPEWTDDGKEDLTKRRYRYVSGGVLLAAKDRRTGKPIGAFLDHVSLTKRPFIQGMAPLLNSLFAGSGRHNPEDPMSKLNTQLASFLGLAADATEETILAALAKAKAPSLGADTLASLGLGADAKPEAIAASISALANKAKVGSELETRLAAIEGAQVDKLVDESIALFKVAPSERAELIALGKEGATGRARLERMIAARAPRPPGPGDVQLGAKSTSETVELQRGSELRKWLAANPGSSPSDALRALCASKPELFVGVVPGVC